MGMGVCSPKPPQTPPIQRSFSDLVKFCSQCGEKDADFIIPWEPLMGRVCKSCFDEVSSCPPPKIVKNYVPEPEKQAKRLKALEAANVARSAKAADKKAKREEDQARRRAENPERYDALKAKRSERMRKIRAEQLLKKKELTPTLG